MDNILSYRMISHGFRLVGSPATCKDVHMVTNAEWSDFPDPITGCAKLIILESELAICRANTDAASVSDLGQCFHTTEDFKDSFLPF